jgi:hypothetical protein
LLGCGSVETVFVFGDFDGDAAGGGVAAEGFSEVLTWKVLDSELKGGLEDRC